MIKAVIFDYGRTIADAEKNRLLLGMALVSRTVNPKKRLRTFKKLNFDRYIVGDRVKSEIVEGNKIGATTIWLKKGKFANELSESDIEKPDYTVKSMRDILPIISKLTN